MALVKYYITTTDNPFDPETQFSEWLNYDHFKGYNTCEKLAAIVDESNKLTDDENAKQDFEAMQEMVKLGGLGKEGKLVEYKILQR